MPSTSEDPEPVHELPQTSLIIPSKDRHELLGETVDSILKADDVPTELIVVDQSASPHERLASLKTDRPCDVRYVHSATVGASRARNLGIAKARYDILVFTDDDVLVEPTWLRDLVSALLEGGRGTVVTGRVLPAAANRSGGFVPSTITDTEPVVYEGRIGEDILYSNNMAMYRSAIDEIGPFDTRLVNAEDNELAFRLLEAGYQIHYRPEPTLHHRAWRSDRDFLRLRWSYGQGQGQYYAKHLGLRDRYMLIRLLREIRVRLGRLVRSLWQDPGRVPGQLVYLLALTYGVTTWIITQRTDA